MSHIKSIATLSAICVALPAAWVAVPHAATPAAPTRWYSAHWGAEACVPIDDIADLTSHERLYYGTGPYHTPTELISGIQQLTGKQLSRINDFGPHSEVYKDVASDVYIILFDDADACSTFANKTKDYR